MVRYFIEQEPNRLYDHSELPAAQKRALKLRDRGRRGEGVLLIAEALDASSGEYAPIGVKGFYYGMQSISGRADAFLSVNRDQQVAA